MNHADYATTLALASAELVAAVHRAEDPRPFINAALSIPAPDDVDEIAALLTVLAAQVNPETDLDDRLFWARLYDPNVVAACRRPKHESGFR